MVIFFGGIERVSEKCKKRIAIQFSKLGFKKRILHKLRKTWYLWFPFPEIVMLVTLKILSMLYNKEIPSIRTFNWEDDFHWFIVFVIFVFSLLKSIAIECFSDFENIFRLKHEVSFSRYNKRIFTPSNWGTLLFYLIQFFVVFSFFYYNLKRLGFVVGMIVFEFAVYYFSGLLQKLNVLAHVVADIVTVGLFILMGWLKVDSSNQLIVFLIFLVMLLIRYLTICRASIRKGGFDISKIFLINGKNYLFSELYSFSLFLTVIAAIISEIYTERNLLVIIFIGIFVYNLFMYLRLFLYQQFGMSNKEVYYFMIAALSLYFYVLLMNNIDINIIVWFFPVLILLLADEMLNMADKKWQNQNLSIARKNKNIFTSIKIFSLTTLFLNHVLLENEQNVLNYRVYNLSLSDIENPLLRDYMVLPLISVLLSMIFTIYIFYLVNKKIISNRNLVERYSYSKVRSKYFRARKRRK